MLSTLPTRTPGWIHTSVRESEREREREREGGGGGGGRERELNPPLTPRLLVVEVTTVWRQAALLCNQMSAGLILLRRSACAFESVSSLHLCTCLCMNTTYRRVNSRGDVNAQIGSVDLGRKRIRLSRQALPGHAARREGSVRTAHRAATGSAAVADARASGPRRAAVRDAGASTV